MMSKEEAEKEELRQQILMNQKSTSFTLKSTLAQLPAEIGQLQNLQKLNLFGVRLTELPPEIGQLQNLQELNLRSNNLAQLPPEIGQLQNLRSLHLSKNQFTQIPAEIWQLHQLKELDLSDNQLTQLPAGIGQLRNLQELDLSSNQFTQVPPEIRQLDNLRYLYLRNNPIQDLSISILANLKYSLKICLTDSPGSSSYWTAPGLWKEWQSNPELRKIISNKLDGEVRSVHEVDRWREYTLLEADADCLGEWIKLLIMTCSSTGCIYLLCVPSDLTSAREAVRWVNWDIDPEEFAVET